MKGLESLVRRRALARMGPWAALPLASAWPGGVLGASGVVITAATPAKPAPPLQLPQDHGAHLDTRIEWWNLKGELRAAGGQALGFHIAFFRTKVEAAENNPSRFAARHVIAARVSLSEFARKAQWHDQRAARIGFGLADTAPDDLRLSLQGWSIARGAAGQQTAFQARIEAQDFTLDLRCVQSQPLMLHGEGGVIHKDPFLGDPTRYYSQPQLAVDGQVGLKKQTQQVSGRAWLDHGWGKRMMAPDAIGSDWLCMNLHDGSALMVFRMRRADGSAVWEGATLRQSGHPDRIFKHEEIRMIPGQAWRSPATAASYPIAWEIELASTRYAVRARMREQEVDGGNGIGDVFWEGLCDLLDAQGRVIGAGYLEMTGYAGELLL